MNMSDVRTWNEFKWDEVLREIDKGISIYFDELPRFIDLPEEEEILMEKMLVCNRGDEYYQILNSIFDSFEDTGDNDFDFFSFQADNWELRNGAELFREIGDLSEEFAALYASGTAGIDSSDGIFILSYYGIILREIIYMLEAPPDLNHFIVALAKRIHGHINSLAMNLRRLSSEKPETEAILEKHVLMLARLRGRTVELCCSSRNDGK